MTSLDLSSHIFLIPSKEIATPDDMQIWENSKAYADLLGFISALNDEVKDKKLRDDHLISDNVKKVLDILDRLNSWIDEIPPVEQPQRFGNKAFKTFYEKLTGESAQLLEQALDPQCHVAIPEISVYLNESFGNSTRIDYGTGHELAFVAFLCCMFKIGALSKDDSVATVFDIFSSYLELCRKLQKTYTVEPAGSHGVWSLDDYQFIPFIWGSSQLSSNKRITPARFVQEDYYGSFYEDYMFLSCIRYICSVKTGPFAEHSNQLWNISGVPVWTKVNSGLIKMYKAEVLSKFPVVQHFLFGSLLTLEPETEAQLRN